MFLCIDFSIDISSLFDFSILKSEFPTCFLIFCVGFVVAWVIQKIRLKEKIEKTDHLKKDLEEKKDLLDKKENMLEEKEQQLEDAVMLSSIQTSKNKFFGKKR